MKTKSRKKPGNNGKAVGRKASQTKEIGLAQRSVAVQSPNETNGFEGDPSQEPNFPLPVEKCPDYFEPGPHTVYLFKLTPSPENESLYRQRTTNNHDFNRLVQSVRESNGIWPESPLLVSRDAYIISGHQRWGAALEVGIRDVPIIVLDIRRSDYTSDEWIAILRKHNIQREKTLDERVRENLVDVNPDEAMRAVADEQIAKSKPKSQTVRVPSTVKRRAAIKGSRGFADAIKRILTGVLKDVLPVSERAIHYRLLPPLNVRTSSGKAGFIYDNNKDSTKALSNMLTRLRLCGEVPWEWIIDETRPVATWNIWPDAAEFLGEKMNDLYTGFARDLLQSQSAHYEIIIEKLAIKGFIDRVAMRYRMPTVCIRGSSGIDARYQLAERFKASGKKGLVLFVLTDCDPAGDSICESTIHSLRDEFEIDDALVKGIRIAMTHQQADALHLPRSDGLTVKESSVTQKFLDRHGRDDCYELDSVPPEVLAGWLDDEIRANIDIDAYNHEVQEQAKDVAKIRATRAATLEVLKTNEV